jgi:hypothetical protein
MPAMSRWNQQLRRSNCLGSCSRTATAVCGCSYGFDDLEGYKVQDLLFGGDDRTLLQHRIGKGVSLPEWKNLSTGTEAITAKIICTAAKWVWNPSFGTAKLSKDGTDQSLRMQTSCADGEGKLSGKLDIEVILFADRPQ